VHRHEHVIEQHYHRLSLDHCLPRLTVFVFGEILWLRVRFVSDLPSLSSTRNPNDWSWARASLMREHRTLQIRHPVSGFTVFVSRRNACHLLLEQTTRRVAGQNPSATAKFFSTSSVGATAFVLVLSHVFLR
jgi:hypothetical protein